MLYIVFKNKHIYDKFHTKEEAIDYLMDLWFDGIEGAKIKKITVDEYKKMCYDNIK